MAAQQGAMFAKKGLGKMFSATKFAVGAIATGVQKARKGYANKHEIGVVNDLRAKGLTPVEHLVEAFKRLYYLLMAGYKHELEAAAALAAKRLTDLEKSTVPLDVVMLLGRILNEESLKYGDFHKKSIVQGMQDFLNMSRMGKDHYDRDSVAHDVYYAVLICAEDFGTEWDQMESCFREAVTIVVEWAGFNHVPAAKSVFHLGQAVNAHARDSEERRQKILKEAESLQIRRNEQERRRLANASASVSPVSSGHSPYMTNGAPPSYQNYSNSGHSSFASQNHQNSGHSSFSGHSSGHSTFSHHSQHSSPAVNQNNPYIVH